MWIRILKLLNSKKKILFIYFSILIDYLDCRPIEDTVGTLAELVKEGKIKYIVIYYFIINIMIYKLYFFRTVNFTKIKKDCVNYFQI